MLIQEGSQFTVGGPLIWYESAQVRLWIILNININDFHHMGMSQICTGADHYFRSSKPHSGKLWVVLLFERFFHLWGRHAQAIFGTHYWMRSKKRVSFWFTAPISRLCWPFENFSFVPDVRYWDKVSNQFMAELLIRLV